MNVAAPPRKTINRNRFIAKANNANQIIAQYSYSIIILMLLNVNFAISCFYLYIFVRVRDQPTSGQ